MFNKILNTIFAIGMVLITIPILLVMFSVALFMLPYLLVGLFFVILCGESNSSEKEITESVED